MEEEIKPLNKRIRKYRKLAGFTQEQVARHLGMLRTTYSHMELHGNPSPESLKSLAKLFNVPLEDIVYSDEEKEFYTKDTQQPLRFNSPTVFDEEEEIMPLSPMEKSAIRVLRYLPKDKADEVIDFIDRIYQETKRARRLSKAQEQGKQEEDK